MTIASRTRASIQIDDVSQLLIEFVDGRGRQGHADEPIDEILQLLLAVSSLDPDAANLLTHSDYVAALVIQARR